MPRPLITTVAMAVAVAMVVKVEEVKAEVTFLAAPSLLRLLLLLAVQR
jgi:hypothetical protein